MSFIQQLRRLAPYVLGLALAVFLVYHWVTRDQREINRNLSRLRSLVEKSGNEGPITGLARVQEIVRFFTPNAEIALGPPVSSALDRDELAVVVHQARSSVEKIRAIVRDRKLSIDRGRRSATMELTAEGIITSHGREERDIREFRLSWTRQDGRWRIAKVELAGTIRRPPGLGGLEL